MLAVLVGVTLLVVARPTWSWIGRPVTVVHELGHALAALTAGYRLRGITVNGDLSGATQVFGRGTAGALWTMWWGYPFPALAGLGLLLAVDAGWSRPALLVLVASQALAFLISRSWHTVAVVLVTGAVFVLVAWQAPADVAVVVVVGVGWLLLAGAVRGVLGLAGVHVRPRGRSARSQSDAHLMAARTRLVPAVFWLLSFLLVVGTCAVLAVRVVLRAVT